MYGTALIRRFARRRARRRAAVDPRQDHLDPDERRREDRGGALSAGERARASIRCCSRRPPIVSTTTRCRRWRSIRSWNSGPVRYYTQHGYIYVHMDVRGSGRSGGTYTYQSHREQRDLYEAIEWIAKQPWSSGKIGGVGQSYYARAQWFMGAQHPPHLSCIAPYDGNIDTYHASAYTGGIPGDYPDSWFDGLRIAESLPARRPPARDRLRLHAASAAPQPLRRLLERTHRRRAVARRSKCRRSRSACGAKSICISTATSSASSA